MSDQLSALNDDTIQWVNATSKNGKPFRIGTKKTEDVVDSNSEATATEKQNFGIGVNWPVTPSGLWVVTTADVQKTAAITQYRLHNTSGEITYDYTLYFTNTQHYNYYFYDETGDNYNVNTWRNGDHYVSYNSDKPTINYITGS